MSRIIEISSRDDTIDVRDVIERIEQLEPIVSLIVDIDNEVSPAKFAEAVQTRCDEAPAEAEVEELQALYTLMADLCGYGGDEQWRGDWYPITLIRDSYFVEAMQELCEDIGDFPKGIPSYYVIDWEATARNLRADYSSIEFDGVTYWYR